MSARADVKGLVERLRFIDSHGTKKGIHTEAADALEALSAENERLREQVDEFSG